MWGKGRSGAGRNFDPKWQCQDFAQDPKRLLQQISSSLHADMPHSILKKRKAEDVAPSQKKKKVRKQKHYSSGSDSEEEDGDFPAINLAESDDDELSASNTLQVEKSDDFTGFEDEKENEVEDAQAGANTSEDDTSDFSSADDDSLDLLDSAADPSTNKTRKKSKRNDPSAFAASISAILSSKLTSSKRPDPVLARSTTAAAATSSISSAKLEAKAKRKLKEDKRKLLSKGRIRNTLLGTADEEGLALDGEGKGMSGMNAAEIAEQEKVLRKTAQRGVVKLFNAVRAAQVKAEEARSKGGPRGQVEERVDEMSKKGFLDMVAAGGRKERGMGGKKMSGEDIEEA